MTGASAEHHGGCGIYARRPLLDSELFEHAQAAVINAMGQSRTFRPRPAYRAGVSLLGGAQMRRAIGTSAVLQAMPAANILARLRHSIVRPQADTEALPVTVGEVDVLRGRQTHLVAYVDAAELWGDQAALLGTIYTLGGVALPRDIFHISFGTFDRRVPDRAIRTLEENLPDTFAVGRVIIDMPGGVAMAA